MYLVIDHDYIHVRIYPYTYHVRKTKGS